MVSPWVVVIASLPVTAILVRAAYRAGRIEGQQQEAESREAREAVKVAGEFFAHKNGHTSYESQTDRDGF